MIGAPAQTQTWELYSSYQDTTDGVALNSPFLIPPSVTPKSPIPVQVPMLYLGESKYDAYTYHNDDFEFKIVSSAPAPPYQKTVHVQITVGTSTWKGDVKARANLAHNFQDLLTQIEAKFERKNVLVPGATRRIWRNVASSLPLTINEILLFQYAMSTGFDPGSRAYVDLLPGMRLRMETSVSQYVSPSAPMNSYVAAGSGTALIGSTSGAHGKRVLTLDPFLGAISAPGIPAPGTGPRPVGGLVDLHTPGAERSHWRLFYPTAMEVPDRPGDTGLDNNIGLVAADTLDQLNKATQNYPNPAAKDTGEPTLYYMILGRAVAVPEIPVMVSAQAQTALQYVPVGTTAADVIQQFADVPLDSRAGVVSMARVAPGQGKSVHISFIPVDQPIATEAYDLPLLAGDNLVFNP